MPKIRTTTTTRSSKRIDQGCPPACLQGSGRLRCPKMPDDQHSLMTRRDSCCLKDLPERCLTRAIGSGGQPGMKVPTFFVLTRALTHQDQMTLTSRYVAAWGGTRCEEFWLLSAHGGTGR